MMDQFEEFFLCDGFTCRVGSADRIAVEDTGRLFRREGAPGSGDYVLDLGAHIGSFTQRALSAEAKYVVAVEPDPENAGMFHLNVKDTSRVKLIRGAISATGHPVALYLGKTHGHSTQLKVGSGRPTVFVPGITLPPLFAQHPFTYLKVDVDGAEYELDLPHVVPDTVTTMFIEFHLTYGQRPKGEALREELESVGWSPLWETNWNRGYVEGVFVR